jgi:hypothetical protein
MSVTLAGDSNATEASDVHFSNDVKPIRQTDDGMMIDVRELQCRNAEFGIVVREQGLQKVTLSRAPQPAKQLLPRKVTLPGMLTDKSDDRSRNAYESIRVRFVSGGKISEVRPWQ